MMNITDRALAQDLLQARNLMLSSYGTDLEEVYGAALYPRLFGHLLSIFVEGNAEDGSSYGSLLKQIPSETSSAERQFLFNFFRYQWQGHYNVLEIGPFLGGTTRAMALGMSLNGNRLERCRLCSYDKFDNYYTKERLLAVLKPLFDKGVLDQKVARHITSTTEFEAVFAAIHARSDYYHLIRHGEGVLPDLPDEIEQTKNLFMTHPGVIFDAVFIDGCKSWFGTKYFMQEVSENVAPGAYFLFQDYGAHTCFWIPVFVYMMQEHFKLTVFVDNT